MRLRNEPPAASANDICSCSPKGGNKATKANGRDAVSIPPDGFKMWSDPTASAAEMADAYRLQLQSEFIELWREEWGAPKVVRPEAMPATMGVVGLYWRPAKFREETRN